MLFFRLLSLLPFWWLYRLSDLLYLVVYRLFGYRVRVVRQNLERSFPQKTKAERGKIERAFYQHLFDVVVESVKSLTITEAELKKRVSHKNPEVCSEITNSGGSFVAMAAHYGNWEWMLLGNKIFIESPVDAVYKPLSNQFFDRLMLKIRGRFDIYPVASTQLLRIEAARKNQPRGIAMVADQTPFPEGAYVTRFLNQDTLFFRGPQKIASLFNCTMLYSGMRKKSRGKYELFVEVVGKPPFADQETALEAFARRLEKDIEEEPAWWLWSHKRWKYNPALVKQKVSR